VHHSFPFNIALNLDNSRTGASRILRVTWLVNYNRHAERRQGTFLSVNEAALRFKVAYFKQKNNRKVHIIANDTLHAKKRTILIRDKNVSESKTVRGCGKILFAQVLLLYNSLFSVGLDLL